MLLKIRVLLTLEISQSLNELNFLHLNLVVISIILFQSLLSGTNSSNKQHCILHNKLHSIQRWSMSNRGSIDLFLFSGSIRRESVDRRGQLNGITASNCCIETFICVREIFIFSLCLMVVLCSNKMHQNSAEKRTISYCKTLLFYMHLFCYNEL